MSAAEEVTFPADAGIFIAVVTTYGSSNAGLYLISVGVQQCIVSPIVAATNATLTGSSGGTRKLTYQLGFSSAEITLLWLAKY